jgi:hypothetical protein
MATSVLGTISSQTAGTATDAVGKADLSIWGTFSATIAIQRQEAGGNWGTIETVDGPVEKVLTNALNMPFRINVTSYSSGTINYRISGQAEYR